MAAKEAADLATGGEPPLDPVPLSEPEAPETTEDGVAEALRPLRERLATDAVLAAEVAPFMDAAWRMVGLGEVRAEAGHRYCKVSPEQVEIGHLAWPGSKRIPF